MAEPPHDPRAWARAPVCFSALLASAAAWAAPSSDGTAVTLVGAWTVAERTAVAATVARIPAEIRARAPRRFVRDATGCGADGWPGDDDDRRSIGDDGAIHLCPPAPGETPLGGARRLALALLLGFDDDAGWSREVAWQRLNRWRPSMLAGFAARPDNQDPGGFAEERGRRSPRWDLATYLAALWLDPPDDHGGIACRLISQARFARRHLRAPPADPACPDFEAWADLPHLGDVEVVLAAPSTAMLGSLFGHLFLRLDYRDGDGDADGGDADADSGGGVTIAAPHLSRTIAFLADNDVPFTEDPAYAIKGIFGRYGASLHEGSFLDAYRDYVVVEGRDLRRWRLRLDPDERRALLERIWTVAHGSRYAYYFFRRNCATLLVDLIDEARARPEVEAAPGLLAAPPATTLEPWAHEATAGTAGEPLLRFVPDPIWSFDHQARAASQRRAALEPSLAAALSPERTAAARRAFGDAHAGDDATRARAYERLAMLLADGGAPRPTDLRAWLRDSAAIEMRLSTAANLDREARAERERRRLVDLAATRAQVELEQAANALERQAAGDKGDGGGEGSARSARRALAARLIAAITQVTALAPETRLLGYRGLARVVGDPALPRTLADRARLLALLQSERRYDVLRMKTVPGLRDALLFADPARAIDGQPYLAGQEALLRLPAETRIAAPLRALQRARQTLFVALNLDQLPDPEPATTARAPLASDLLAARRDYEASLPHSGIDRFSALAALSFGAPPARPGLILAGALYDEQLGDHHRFGFSSDTALVVARSAAFLSVADARPTLAAYDARLFGYRSLRTALPESSGGRWPLGWELWGDLDGDRARGLASGAALGWGVLGRLRERDDLGDHLLAGLAVAYHAQFSTAAARTQTGREDHAQAAGAPLALELRAGVGPAPRYRSDLSARLWIEPTMLLTGPHRGMAVAYGARIEAHIALRGGPRPLTDAHDPALVARAQIIRTPLTFLAEAATLGLVSIGVDLR